MERLDGHHGLALACILLITLLLGLVKLWLDPPSFEFNWENRWWQIALNVKQGLGYVSCKPIYFPFCGPDNQITAMREPLPVLLFAAIAALTNESLTAAAFSGVIVNLGVLLAVYGLARELSSPRTGLLAALLWALYLAPVRLFYSQISGDLFAALGITCGLMFYLRARRTGEAWYWPAAGICLGLAILSRSAVLVIALVLSGGLLFRQHPKLIHSLHPRRQRFLPLFLFALSWMAVMTPWFARNYLVFQQPVIGSTLSGYYLYRQNHILLTENYLRFVSGGEFLPVLERMLERRQDLQGNENEAQMDQVYRAEALRIIKEEPSRYVELSAYRFLMLWFNWGVNEVYGKENSAVDNLIVFQHLLLIGGGITGLLLRRRQAWPLGISILAFCGLYMAVMAHLPYVVSVVPLLVVLSALAVGDIVRKATLSKGLLREGIRLQ